MAVSFCICNRITFRQALGVARAHGCDTVGELMEHCELGTGCGLCIPYMQRSLMTGETDLPVLGKTELEKLTALANLDTGSSERIVHGD